MNSQQHFPPAGYGGNKTSKRYTAVQPTNDIPFDCDDDVAVSTERLPGNIFLLVGTSNDEGVQLPHTQDFPNAISNDQSDSRTMSGDQKNNSNSHSLGRDESSRLSSVQKSTRRFSRGGSKDCSNFSSYSQETSSRLGGDSGDLQISQSSRKTTSRSRASCDTTAEKPDPSDCTSTTSSDDSLASDSSIEFDTNRKPRTATNKADVSTISAPAQKEWRQQHQAGDMSQPRLPKNDRIQCPNIESRNATFRTDQNRTPSKASFINEQSLEDDTEHMIIEVDTEQPSLLTKDEDYTNDPHPALETPLLYFLIRPFPRLLTAIQFFYNMRWDTSYPLQNRIPFSRQIRKINIILTWSELFLLLPFFALIVAGTIYSIFDPSVSISGHTARTPLIFCFITAMKNNFLTFFLGMPVERAIKYHKLSARIAYINSLLHTIVAFRHPIAQDSNTNFFYFLFQDSICSGGTMLVFFMTGMIISALPYIRRKLFEFFYCVHLILVVLMMVCAYYHTGVLVPILASLTWGLDFLIRKVYMPFCRYPRNANLKIISDTVVELSFPKADGFDFNPGQYIYIAVPKLGYLEWHPFSLSSSPKQKMVTLHIRKVGDWTGALYELAQKQSDISILIEGPYGSVGVDLTNPYKYQTVMLFSGGIGVTPMQSLCNSLMYEHNHGMRRLRKLSFVWIERDPVVMPEVDVVRRESIRCLDSTDSFDLEDGTFTASSPDRHPRRRRAGNNQTTLDPTENAEGATNLAAQLLAMVPPSQDTDAEFESYYPISSDFELLDIDEDDVFLDDPSPIETPLQRSNAKRMSRSVSFKVKGSDPSWRAGEETSVDHSFLDHAFNDSDESPLDLQVYLTNKNIPRATKKKMEQMPFVHLGRPDIKGLFHSARHEALRNGQHRVAVCVCAPLRIVDLVRKGCAKYSDRYVAFDFHFEVFE